MPKKTLEQLWNDVKKQANEENPEMLLYALADFFNADSEYAEHPTVKALLNGCATSCRQAAFDYYASTK